MMHFVSQRPSSVFLICDTSVVFCQKFQRVRREGLHLGKEQLKLNQFTSPGDPITRTKKILITGAWSTTQHRGGGARCSLVITTRSQGRPAPAGSCLQARGSPLRAPEPPRPSCRGVREWEELPGCPWPWLQGLGRQGFSLVCSWLSLAPA